MSAEVLLLLVRAGMAIALYGFLGAVFYVLWRDVAAASQPVRDGLIPRGRLEVIERGDTPLEIGQTYRLRRMTTLGRAPTSTITLPDSFASLAHAQILLRGDRWWLEDRNSRNGTLVNQIPVTDPIVLSTGDVITIGGITLRVDLDESPHLKD